jgi:hypothetical protein
MSTSTSEMEPTEADAGLSKYIVPPPNHEDEDDAPPASSSISLPPLLFVRYATMRI